jgi:hypothetical protein
MSSGLRLGPSVYRWDGGLRVKLNDDARKLVVFFGLRTTDKNGAPIISYGGTGFLISFPAESGSQPQRITYLVTARHVERQLAGPFVVSLIEMSGQPQDIDIDQAIWTPHPDDDVDVVVTRFPQSDAGLVVFATESFATNADYFGVGDMVHIVGLYRLMPGRTKISPVVHTGNIAMTPTDEIPVYDKLQKKVVPTRGYLIEAQTLEGLSGSPVFVRYTNVSGISSGRGRLVTYTDHVYLLGIWQSAWEGIPDDVLGQQIGVAGRVPVGMGITIPAQRITETLAQPALVEERRRLSRELEEKNAASID